MKKIDRIITQGSSARWLLTVIAGMCLLMMTYINCRCMLKGISPLPVSNEAIFSVITMVFVSYFNKNGRSIRKEEPRPDEDAPHN